MLKPNYLKKGDKVAIVATAKCLPNNEIAEAIKHIESWGLSVVEGASLYKSYHQFAGTDAERTAGLQRALDDPIIKAVFFARGGYGTARIIDNIDWSTFQKNPKWLCGFSDLTVLHSHVHQNLGMETVHSTMPIFFKDGMPNAGSHSLKDALFGTHNSIKWQQHELNRTGECSGQLIGGNLSVLYSIMGTPSQMDFAGKILLLEDLTENLYHLDRMMMQLKRAGHLRNLEGIVVGQFTDMTDNPIPFGKSPEEIIFDAVSEYAYPVAFDAPIGHVKENLSIYHGAHYNLEVQNHPILNVAAP